MGCRLRPESISFAAWWCVTLVVLGVAVWIAAKSSTGVGIEQVGLALIVGVAAGLVLYLAPSGTASIQSLQALQLRFFAALGISWLVALRSLPPSAEGSGYPALALAAFAGVNAPLLAFAASSFMVCGGGQPSCAL